MIAVLGLAGYLVLVAALGPALLGSLTAGGSAPRLAVAAWLAAVAGTVGAALALVALSVSVAARYGGRHAAMVADCMGRLHRVATGASGAVAQTLLIAVAASAVTGAAMAALRLARTVLRLRRGTVGHAAAARLVGRCTADADVVLIEAAEPAAYAVAGRPATIVLTSAAVAVLDERQLAAVLAHERAHLAGRHATVLTGLRALAAIAPRVGLFAAAAERVPLLLEMCADDAAARRCGRRAVLSGLAVLCGAVPAGTLGAAGLGVAARVQRLAAPGEDSRRLRIVLSTVIVGLAGGPLLMILLGAGTALMCC